MSDLDFDEASRAWLANKRKMSNGGFEYTCNYWKRNKNCFCRKRPVKGNEFCSYHIKAKNQHDFHQSFTDSSTFDFVSGSH